jgi:hypothetical protein
MVNLREDELKRRACQSSLSVFTPQGEAHLLSNEYKISLPVLLRERKKERRKEMKREKNHIQPTCCCIYSTLK